MNTTTPSITDHGTHISVATSLGPVQFARGTREYEQYAKRRDGTPAPDHSRSLAEYYAERFNAMDAGGYFDFREFMHAADELTGGDWTVFRTPQGKWTARHVDDVSQYARELEGCMQFGMRAPKGHTKNNPMIVGGRAFTGGMFIPNEVLAQATPAQKAELEENAANHDEKKAQRAASRKAAGVDVEGVRGHLKEHARPLTAKEQTRAKQIHAALKNHHGELTLHRLGELVTADKAALAKAKAAGVTAGAHVDYLKNSLAMHSHMLEAHVKAHPEHVEKAKGVKKAVEVASEPTKAKEPHEQTRNEFYGGKLPSGKSTTSTGGFDHHKDAIKQAINRGKVVPPEVLKDYPELAAQHAPSTEKPSAISKADAAAAKVEAEKAAERKTKADKLLSLRKDKGKGEATPAPSAAQSTIPPVAATRLKSLAKVYGDTDHERAFFTRVASGESPEDVASELMAKGKWETKSAVAAKKAAESILKDEAGRAEAPAPAPEKNPAPGTVPLPPVKPWAKPAVEATLPESTPDYSQRQKPVKMPTSYPPPQPVVPNHPTDLPFPKMGKIGGERVSDKPATPEPLADVRARHKQLRDTHDASRTQMEKTLGGEKARAKGNRKKIDEIDARWSKFKDEHSAAGQELSRKAVEEIQAHPEWKQERTKDAETVAAKRKETDARIADSDESRDKDIWQKVQDAGGADQVIADLEKDIRKQAGIHARTGDKKQVWSQSRLDSIKRQVENVKRLKEKYGGEQADSRAPATPPETPSKPAPIAEPYSEPGDRETEKNPKPFTPPLPKETHEQTRDEFANTAVDSAAVQKLKAAGDMDGFSAASNQRSKARDQHRAAVSAALAAGKPVPPEVLADYPDLAKKAAKGDKSPLASLAAGLAPSVPLVDEFRKGMKDGEKIAGAVGSGRAPEELPAPALESPTSPVPESAPAAPTPAPVPAVKPTPPAINVPIKQVTTSRGTRHAHGFAPSDTFWQKYRAGTKPNYVSVYKNKDGSWEATVYGASAEEVAKNLEDLQNRGMYPAGVQIRKPATTGPKLASTPAATPAAAAETKLDIPSLLAKHNRTPRDGKGRSAIRHIGNGKREKVAALEKHNAPQVGEVVNFKDGSHMVTKVDRMQFISEDDIEDQDAWSSYPSGPGWYASYETTPVQATGEETSAKEAKATQAQAKESAVKLLTTGEGMGRSEPSAKIVRTLGHEPRSGSVSGGYVVADENGVAYHVRPVYDDSPVYTRLAASLPEVEAAVVASGWKQPPAPPVPTPSQPIPAAAGPLARLTPDQLEKEKAVAKQMGDEEKVKEIEEVKGKGAEKKPSTNWRDDLKGKPRWQAVEILRQRQPHELTHDEYESLKTFDHESTGGSDPTFKLGMTRGGDIEGQHKKAYADHLKNQWEVARDSAFAEGKPVASKPHWAMTRKEYESDVGNTAEEHKESVATAVASGKPVPESVLADYPDIAKKPAEQSAVAPPTPWHANREPVFAAMRKIDAEVQRQWGHARELGPRHGAVSVGSADFDHTLKATVGESYLRALRAGKTPEEAREIAAADGKEAVAKWNTQGSKGRMAVSHKAELHRWEGAGESEADAVHRRFMGEVGEGKEEPKEEAAAPAKEEPQPAAPPIPAEQAGDLGEPSADAHDAAHRELNTLYRSPGYKNGDRDTHAKVQDLESQLAHHRPAALARAQGEIDRDEAAREAKEKEPAKVEDRGKPYINPADLAAHYKASGMPKHLAWDQFVKDTILSPIARSEKMDAGEFSKAFESVTAGKSDKYPGGQIPSEQAAVTAAKAKDYAAKVEKKGEDAPAAPAQTRGEYAADLYDSWIAPLKRQMEAASGEKKKNLKKQIETLNKQREEEVNKKFGPEGGAPASPSALAGWHKEAFDKLAPSMARQIDAEISVNRKANIAYRMLDGEPPAVQKALIAHLQSIAPEVMEYAGQNRKNVPIGVKDLFPKVEPKAAADPYKKDEQEQPSEQAKVAAEKAKDYEEKIAPAADDPDAPPRNKKPRTTDPAHLEAAKAEHDRLDMLGRELYQKWDKAENAAKHAEREGLKGAPAKRKAADKLKAEKDEHYEKETAAQKTIRNLIKENKADSDDPIIAMMGDLEYDDFENQYGMQNKPKSEYGKKVDAYLRKRFAPLVKPEEMGRAIDTFLQNARSENNVKDGESSIQWAAEVAAWPREQRKLEDEFEKIEYHDKDSKSRARYTMQQRYKYASDAPEMRNFIDEQKTRAAEEIKAHKAAEKKMAVESKERVARGAKAIEEAVRETKTGLTTGQAANVLYRVGIHNETDQRAAIKAAMVAGGLEARPYGDTKRLHVKAAEAKEKGDPAQLRRHAAPLRPLPLSRAAQATLIADAVRAKKITVQEGRKRLDALVGV